MNSQWRMYGRQKTHVIRYGRAVRLNTHQCSEELFRLSSYIMDNYKQLLSLANKLKKKQRIR
ncbi:CLUMA_CG007475, isoform A [Clunio marinus]|uniref:CLUMA_CG007475, isoform A n=1 Tax=Clunio marinus TaxID=568069 RepID=A0A1J1I2Y1_9DIPT|nr:CLUMA_CG007475, isoform A [Clunio marinus]